MGGPGSGRREYATTPTVEESFHIDADNLTEGVDYPGVHGTKRWGDEEDPTVDLTVHFEPDDKDADRATHVRLEYTVADRWSDRTTENTHPVELEYTECNFGGVRPWFRCPGVVDGEECRRRVRKLYLPRGAVYWLCRECYDLGYRSSRTSGDDVKQAELRYRRAFAKADAEDRRPHPNGTPYLPEKPKGMHRDTFDDLLADVRAAGDEWDRQLTERMRELVERYNTEA
jgi:hypothetical protein